MGEIADDCYDRALDELEMIDVDPDYYGGGYSASYHRGPFRYSYAPYREASLLEFENISEPDFVDLLGPL